MTERRGRGKWGGRDGEGEIEGRDVEGRERGVGCFDEDLVGQNDRLGMVGDEVPLSFLSITSVDRHQRSHRS